MPVEIQFNLSFNLGDVSIILCFDNLFLFHYYRRLAYEASISCQLYLVNFQAAPLLFHVSSLISPLPNENRRVKEKRLRIHKYRANC